VQAASSTLATRWAELRWEPMRCRALNSGVAYRRATQDASLVAGFADCPGVSWCASEGEECQCVGEVTYRAAVLPSDGLVQQQVARTASSGALRCSHGSELPFQSDPAPGHRKACYCTPQRILDILGERWHQAENCTGVANDAFDPDAVGGGREYLPWALVELPDAGGLLRCAYGFGAPIASQDANLRTAQASAQDWTDVTTCMVQSIKSPVDCCAVALRRLDVLIRQSALAEHIIGAAGAIILAVTCCTVLLDVSDLAGGVSSSDYHAALLGEGTFP